MRISLVQRVHFNVGRLALVKSHDLFVWPRPTEMNLRVHASKIIAFLKSDRTHKHTYKRLARFDAGLVASC